MIGDWERRWKPQFDKRIASLLEMYEHEMGDAAFNTPHQEMESPSFHAAHNPTQVGPDWSVLDKGSGWYLSLSSQRRLPRYLSAITLFSGGNRVTEDHFEYWRCTGAYASMVSELAAFSLGQEVRIFDGSPDSVHNLPGSQVQLSESMLNDLCILLQLSILGEYTTEVHMPEWALGYFEMNPILERLVTNWSVLSATQGFPVLEGLLKEQRGEPNDDETSFFWSLKKWLEQVENTETKKTIVEIDRLGQVDIEDKPEAVVKSINELLDKETLNSEDHLIRSNVGLLWELRQRRNDAQHRNQTVRGVAVVVVTLCCLIFWNAINENTFQNLRKRIQTEVEQDMDRQQQVLRRGRFYPDSFY